MSMIDRFICRREGHKPSVTITHVSDITHQFLTTCQRCGRWFDPNAEQTLEDPSTTERAEASPDGR
jgi:hypothetical protein